MRFWLAAAATLLTLAASPLAAQPCWGIPSAKHGVALQAGQVRLDSATGVAVGAVYDVRGPLTMGVGYAGHENELGRAIHRWSARLALDLTGGRGGVCYGVGYTYATLDGPGVPPRLDVREHRVPTTVAAGTILDLPGGVLLVPAASGGPMFIWSETARGEPFRAVALAGGASLTVAAGPAMAMCGVTVNSNSGIPTEWSLGIGIRL